MDQNERNKLERELFDLEMQQAKLDGRIKELRRILARDWVSLRTGKSREEAIVAFYRASTENDQKAYFNGGE